MASDKQRGFLESCASRYLASEEYSVDHSKFEGREQELNIARRAAFVARFIVLREGKRTRAHRYIERMAWNDACSAEQLAKAFRDQFQHNGDKMEPVDRDLARALAHANRSITHFVHEYTERSTDSFVDALFDYERSNSLLFGDGDKGADSPKHGGWRMPRELKLAVERGEAEVIHIPPSYPIKG